MMTHSSFTYLRSKSNKKVYLFYGTYDDYLKEYSKEDRMDYEETPVPFEELNVDDLAELLTSILEDRNSHRTLYMVDILRDVLKEDVDPKTAAKIMRHYILCLEAKMLKRKEE